MHKSSTETLPEVKDVPQHVAIIMDGNGRWATQRRLPRAAGHVKGVEAVRRTIEAAATAGVRYVTLFAFSSENWRRPKDEVSILMSLFVRALEREIAQLRANDIRLKVVGQLDSFEPRLRELIRLAEQRTAQNKGLVLTVAANYGGRWDILQAMKQVMLKHPEFADPSNTEPIPEELLAENLSMAYAPEPDLFIRTGGEQRISNFLLWQLAYTELYFTDSYWPDFGAEAFARALESYRGRERRFGRTSAQIEAA